MSCDKIYTNIKGLIGKKLIKQKLENFKNKYTNKKIISSIDLVVTKFHLALLFTTLACIIFEDYFIKIINKIFVEYIFNKITVTHSSILFGIVITIGIIYFYKKFLCQFRFSYNTYKLTICITIIFLYYQLFTNHWRYMPYNWTIGYIDILVAFIDIIFIVLLVYNLKQSKQREPKQIQLLQDTPINKEESIELLPSRKESIYKLRDLIINIQSSNSYAIGITSSWGNGKTSFLNGLINSIENKDRLGIIIEFSPWYCNSHIDILSQFLDTLSNHLKEYQEDISKQINKYSKIILSYSNNKISKFIDKEFNLFSDSKDIKQLYNTINKRIASLNRKIYITIDDIDRLNSKEILECLKIIRNTANFKNVIFIVAYDKEYILSELCKEGLSEKYLEKIIQLEYNLPEIEEYELKDFIFMSLKNDIINNDEKLREIDNDVRPKSYISVNYNKSIPEKHPRNEHFKEIENVYNKSEIDLFLSTEALLHPCKNLNKEINKQNPKSQFIISTTNITSKYRNYLKSHIYSEYLRNYTNSRSRKDEDITIDSTQIISKFIDLNNKIDEETNKLLIHTFKEDKSNDLNYKPRDLNLDIFKYFSNIRDCKRILNSFFTYKTLIGDEIELPELFLICILKIIYPKEALELYINLDKCFTVNKKGVSLIDLDFIDNQNKKELNGLAKTKARYYIKEISSEKDFLDLIYAIFLRKKYTYKSAAYNNFQTYYNGSISDRIIRSTDFIKYLGTPVRLLNQLEILNKGNSDEEISKSKDLHKKIEIYIPTNKELAVSTLYGLLYLANIKDNISFAPEITRILNSFNNDTIYILNRIINDRYNLNLIPLKNYLKVCKDEDAKNNPNIDFIIDLDDKNKKCMAILKSIKIKLTDNNSLQNLKDIRNEIIQISGFNENKEFTKIEGLIKERLSYRGIVLQLDSYINKLVELKNNKEQINIINKDFLDSLKNDDFQKLNSNIDNHLFAKIEHTLIQESTVDTKINLIKGIMNLMLRTEQIKRSIALIQNQSMKKDYEYSHDEILLDIHLETPEASENILLKSLKSLECHFYIEEFKIIFHQERSKKIDKLINLIEQQS